MDVKDITNLRTNIRQSPRTSSCQRTFCSAIAIIAVVEAGFIPDFAGHQDEAQASRPDPCLSHVVRDAPQEREYGNSPAKSSTPVLASVHGKIGKENAT